MRIGRFSVTLIGEDGIQHRYLHLEPTSLVVSRGDEVARGERIGRVSNAFFDRDGNRVLTTIHLHYDVQMNLEGRNVFVPPYASLVESYQALLRSPEERCAPIPGVGREIAETEGCVDWFGPARYWRREESEQARGGGLYWTNTHPGRHPADYARYRLDLRSAGRYTVEAHVVAPYNESRRALYVVRHRGGERPAETEVQVDQRDEQGWVPVGTFAFARGGDQWVEVRDNTGERRKPFSLDSLRLVPEPSEPSESPE